MRNQEKYFTFTIYIILIAVGNLQSIKEEKISLSVPKLSEEENDSNHMPKHLRCDACLAIAHQMYAALSKFKNKRNIKESDILDTVENTCNSGFNEYGIKQVHNVNRLSGPGLETEKHMGMSQMGGRWPHRLQEMCHYYVGEVGEFHIFDAFLDGIESLTDMLCYRYGNGILSYCTQVTSSKTEL